MSGNHFLLSMTVFSRQLEENPSYPTEYGYFKFKANWESEAVEVTADANGTEGRLPYSSDPNNPYNNNGTQDPPEYNNVPLYIEGQKYLAHNIKYENTGNQAPYFTAGGGTGFFFVTFEDGQRVYIPTDNQGWQFTLVRPASGGAEELLISFPQTFMNNLGAAMKEHGAPVSLDMGYTSYDGSNPMNNGKGALLASTAADSDAGAPFPCFVRGTFIMTERGAIAVEDIRVGDMVLTADHGLQPVRWIGSRALTVSDLIVNPKLCPIRILRGALGADVPQRDLLVSPQHRMLVRSKIAQRMFGAMEILVSAKHLLDIDGVEIAENCAGVEYFHMLFDRHEIVWANGAETESLFTGPEALKALGEAVREEIFALFPDLRETESAKNQPEAARVLTNGKFGRKFARTHQARVRSLMALQ